MMMVAIVLLSSCIFVLCWHASVHGSQLASSPLQQPHFSDSNTLWSRRQSRFAFQWKPFVLVLIRGSISTIRRASMHLPPHLLISELGETHTAPCCTQASAARRHWSLSHQADNTLVLCQQLNTEIRHGQRCTTIASTDWSGAHSWLWHRPTARYWIAVFFAPSTIFLFSRKAPNSAINATHFNWTSIMPKDRRGGIRVSRR